MEINRIIQSQIFFRSSLLIISIFLFSCSRELPTQPVFTAPLWDKLSINGAVNLCAADHFGNVYAFTGKSIMRSSDNGSSWQEVQKDDKFYFTNNQSMIVENTDTLFVARPVYTSHDSGKTWYSLSSEYFDAMTQDAQGVLYATSQGYLNKGVSRSMDRGNTWIKCNPGLTTTSILSITTTTNGNIFVGAYKDGLYKSTDLGNNWQRSKNIEVHLADTSLDVEYVKTIGNQLFASVAWHGLYRSTDEGISWKYAGFTDIVDDIITDGKNNYVAHVVGSETSIWYSTDLGLSWKPLDQSVNGRAITINSVAIDNSGYIYFASDYYKTNGLYKSKKPFSEMIK